MSRFTGHVSVTASCGGLHAWVNTANHPLASPVIFVVCVSPCPFVRDREPLELAPFSGILPLSYCFSLNPLPVDGVQEVIKMEVAVGFGAHTDCLWNSKPFNLNEAIRDVYKKCLLSARPSFGSIYFQNE